MLEWGEVGKLFVVAGVALIVLGGVLMLSPKLPAFTSTSGWLGRLPGDIYIKRDNLSVYFPLVTGLVISVILSLVFYLLSLFLKR